MFTPIMAMDEPPEPIRNMGGKYNYNEQDAARATARIVGTLNALTAQLEAQKAKGSRYFIGNAPTALDFYWTSFSNLVEIISWEKIPIGDDLRPLFEQTEPAIAAAFSPILREHRNRFFDEHFVSPMEFA